MLVSHHPPGMAGSTILAGYPILQGGRPYQSAPQLHPSYFTHHPSRSRLQPEVSNRVVTIDRAQVLLQAMRHPDPASPSRYPFYQVRITGLPAALTIQTHTRHAPFQAPYLLTSNTHRVSPSFPLQQAYTHSCAHPPSTKGRQTRPAQRPVSIYKYTMHHCTRFHQRNRAVPARNNY